jgi:membrane protein implicated in regulation of membrane protease activity
MENTSATIEISDEPLAKYVRVGLVVFLVLTAGFTSWLLIRRVSGVLRTLTDGQIATIGIATVLVAVVWRSARRRVADNRPTLFERWLPTAVVVATMVTLVSPSGPWGSWTAVTLLALIAEIGWHRFIEPLGTDTRQSEETSRHAPTRGVFAQAESLEYEEEEEVEESEIPPDEVQQKWVRSLLDDGSEQIWGIMRVHFQPDQRIAIAHAAFCPVLERPPEVEAYAVQGPDATVRATAVQHHGVRFEVRLAQSARQSEVVTIEVMAASVIQ